VTDKKRIKKAIAHLWAAENYLCGGFILERSAIINTARGLELQLRLDESDDSEEFKLVKSITELQQKIRNEGDSQ
jgi:hypothetical protein